MCKKTTSALSDFVLLLVSHIGRLVLNKNAKRPFVAICFGFREKIASFTGLFSKFVQMEVLGSNMAPCCGGLGSNHRNT